MTAIAPILPLYDVTPAPQPNIPARTQPTPSMAMPSNKHRLLRLSVTDMVETAFKSSGVKGVRLELKLEVNQSTPLRSATEMMHP